MTDGDGIVYRKFIPLEPAAALAIAQDDICSLTIA
jgi:hypothetical protein